MDLKQNLELNYPRLIDLNLVLRVKSLEVQILGISMNGVFNNTIVIQQENYDECGVVFAANKDYYYVRQAFMDLESTLAQMKNMVKTVYIKMMINGDSNFFYIDDI